MAHIFKTPFANAGDKITIPSVTQADGSVSLPQGWGFDYERPREISPGVPDPDYKPVGREEMNGVLFMATQAIGEIQLQGAASWSSLGAPYPINAVVYHNSRAWLSTAATNNTEPGAVGASWIDAYQRRFFTSGEALPTANVGPIWHDDYNSLMTWQSFTANGASYTGYASQFVGRIEMDTQPTSRPGYRRVGSETLALSRSQFAALRAWGLHNGRFVAVGVWQAGTLLMADNADGVTFRAFDVRGEFPRFWDDGRGLDSGRNFGTQQDDAIRNITGWNRACWEADLGTGEQAGGAFSFETAPGNNEAYETASGGRRYEFDASKVVPTAAENRPVNTAFSAMLKF